MRHLANLLSSGWLGGVVWGMKTTKMPEDMISREDAIAMLVEQDVAKWGEGEREASKRQHAKLTHGLALNSLYSRAYLDGREEEAKKYQKMSKAVRTSADEASLRKGG